MAKDFNFTENGTVQSVEPARTVLTTDILVGHVVSTPLQPLAQIGLGVEITSAIDSDSFDFIADTPFEFVPTIPDDNGTVGPITPVEVVEDTPPAPQGSDWDIEVFEDGRQVLTPENDILQARLGNRVDGEQHIGTRAADALTGTDGDDVLIGAKGDDIMTGGQGADVFVFSQSSTGTDRITDFTVGQDHLYFAADTVFDLDEISITQQGDDTLLSWHRGHSEVLLEDVNAIDLDADSFILAAL
ncbi:hypothetical protein SAMN06273572_10862 [Monaibacterium marinum]|uniref:Hemolysin-type calcium-binding repeat-containing protein n=1 Tax=Pontivivens marinum TaxID=1690039 RepID=A0A2C9CXM0_9RHOB|nr:hypothetical protein [Monaibacterium marinum]SOH95189.1 hypothetical protein SAMN06273572_10862 [Monaibacterium marinum]